MFKKLLNIFAISVISLAINACDSNQEKHKKTLEEKLIDSFGQADLSARNQVSLIVSASEEKKYAQAMNELAILSATNLNSREQEFAINQLMNQLRFNLEEIELAGREETVQR